MSAQTGCPSVCPPRVGAVRANRIGCWSRAVRCWQVILVRAEIGIWR